MLKEVTLKEALAAMVDGEKIMMLDTENGSVSSLDELLKPLFEKGIRFLHDADTEQKDKKKTRTYAPGKRPGRKPKSTAVETVPTEPSGSGKDNGDKKEDSGSESDPDPDSPGPKHNDSIRTAGTDKKDPEGNIARNKRNPDLNKETKKTVTYQAYTEPDKEKRTVRPAIRKNEAVEKRAIEALAMKKSQREVAAILGVTQPSVSRFALLHKNEIRQLQESMCSSSSGMPQATIEYLKSHQKDPDDGSRNCETCVYSCQNKAHGNCSYVQMTGKPRGCVPWRCFQYKKIDTTKAL